MRLKLVVSVVALTALLVQVSSSFGAYSEPVIEKASLTVVKHGFRPTWNVRYLLCYQGSSPLQAQISEYSYQQGAKFRTLHVQTRGQRSLADPSDLGGTGTCAWYQSRTYRSKFPQRAGSVTGVTLQVYASSTSGRAQTRTFRLNP